MNISTQAKLISTALVAVAIAAPIAHGESDGTLIYRASQKAAASSPSSYLPLKSGKGFSFKAPSYWSTAQTPPVRINRSLEVPPQYLGAEREVPSDRQVFSLGTALNEYQQKIGARTPSEQTPSASSTSFDWADAGIGAAVVAGLGMLGLGGFLAVRRRHVLAQLDV
jgi:MYXO-CTERM domain-containing protein